MSDEKGKRTMTTIAGIPFEVDVGASAEGHGTDIAIYGCYGSETVVYGPIPPSTPVPDRPWYPGPTVPYPVLPITPTTNLNPPRECEQCHHLFATVQEWNDHVDACVENHRGHTNAGIKAHIVDIVVDAEGPGSTCQIEEALCERVNKLAPGEPLYLSDIMSWVMNVSNLRSMNLAEPVADIIPGPDEIIRTTHDRVKIRTKGARR